MVESEILKSLVLVFAKKGHARAVTTLNQRDGKSGALLRRKGSAS